MFDELRQYSENDHFFFDKEKPLKDSCNAPKNRSGVYLVNALSLGSIEIVYIGSSGKILNDGLLKQREGGLYDRIVNGKQFNGPRRKTWPLKMDEEQIDALDIYWYETFNNSIQHIPKYVEGLVLQKYFELYNQLPMWNKEY